MILIQRTQMRMLDGTIAKTIAICRTQSIGRSAVTLPCKPDADATEFGRELIALIQKYTDEEVSFG